MFKPIIIVALAVSFVVAIGAMRADEAKAATATVYNCTDRKHSFSTENSKNLEGDNQDIPAHHHRTMHCGGGADKCKVCLDSTCSGPSSGPIMWTTGSQHEWRAPGPGECG